MLKTETPTPMHQRDLFYVGASSTFRAGRFETHHHRRPAVYVAGCRDCSSSSKRRSRRPTQRPEEETRPVEDTCPNPPEEQGAADPMLSSIVSTQSMLDAMTPVSVTARIRRRLPEMKYLPFLNCISPKQQDTATPKQSSPERKWKAKATLFGQRKKETAATSSTTPRCKREPSIRIRALFPEPAHSKKKLMVKDSLTKLKSNVFRQRSATPTNFPDIHDGCDSSHTAPSTYSSAVSRRCRRQETLVKMMEKTLEEVDEGVGGKQDVDPAVPSASVDSSVKPQTTDASSSHPEKEHRHIRSRKIKTTNTHRPKSRRVITHRRTATC